MGDSDVFNVNPNVAPVLETDADGRLFYEGDRTGFSRFDRSYIAVAAQAFANERDVALVYPSPPTHVQIPILLAVGFQSKQSAPALFVSNRSGIRDQYFRLGLGSKFAPPDVIDPNPLADFTAPMIRTGDGRSLSHITHHKPWEWDSENPNSAAIVHSTFGKKIATTLSPELELSGFVLDFTTGLLDDPDTQEAYRSLAEKRDVPRVMIFDSPNHPYLETLERQSQDGDDVLFWGWASSAIRSAPGRLLEPLIRDAGPAAGDTLSDGGTVRSPFTDSVHNLENVRRGIKRTTVEIAHDDLQKVARAAYERISAASKFPRDTPNEYSGSSRRAITNAYFLYMYLDTLPTSVEFHDSLTSLDDTTSWGTADTLGGKVDRLQEQASTLDRDVPGSGGILEEACDRFNDMIELLTKHNPKADAIVEEIRTARDEDRDVCVFTATRKQESLLRSFVAEMTEFGREDDLTEHIFFQSLYSPHTIPSTDVALFPGVPTKSHYPAVQTGAAGEQRFVTYDWDVGRLQSRLDDIVQTAEWRVGPGVQHYTATALSLGTEGLSKYVTLDTPRRPTLRDYTEADTAGSESITTSRRSSARSIPEDERVGTSPTLTDDEISIDLGELGPDEDQDADYATWKRELEYDDGTQRETIDEGRTGTHLNEEGETHALRVGFVDGTVLYEEPRGLLWGLVSDEHGSVKRVRRAAASLKPGDQVLLIQDDSRRDVFEHVVEKIHDECRGQFQRYLMMLDLWNNGLDQIVDYWREAEKTINEADPMQDFGLGGIKMKKSDMAHMIAEDLTEYAEEHGLPEVRREWQTVQQWLERSTLGPSSPKVIEALGDIHGIESLQSHSREIHAGLEEIRRLHMNIGQKLEKIIFSSQSAESDEWILEEAGLRVGDVQDATVVKTVDTVSEDLSQVARSEVGKLLDEPNLSP